MENTFSQIETLPLADRISQLIEEAIMRGDLRPGEPVNTYKLARQFKVSHIPVREALKKLETLGLVVLEANKSARVVDLSSEDVRHIFEVRKTLEGLAVYLATTRMNAAGRKELQAAVKVMSRAAKSKDLVSMLAADKRFHETIWGLAGNPFLIKALGQLLLPYFGYLASKFSYAHNDYLMGAPREHQELLDALFSGDGDHARRVVVRWHDSSMAWMLSVGSKRTGESSNNDKVASRQQVKLSTRPSSHA